MKGKSDRIESEMRELKVKNLKLFNILADLDAYSKRNYGIELILTHIHRTKEEHAALYPNPLTRPLFSGHFNWLAADCRSSVFTKEQILELQKYIEGRYDITNAFRRTVIYHKIDGNAYHLHIQYREKNSGN